MLVLYSLHHLLPSFSSRLNILLSPEGKARPTSGRSFTSSSSQLIFFSLLPRNFLFEKLIDLFWPVAPQMAPVSSPYRRRGTRLFFLSLQCVFASWWVRECVILSVYLQSELKKKTGLDKPRCGGFFHSRTTSVCVCVIKITTTPIKRLCVCACVSKRRRVCLLRLCI